MYTEGISFLAQAAQDLQKKHPLIHYHIYSGDAEHVMEKLDKGLIDFGLLVGEADISKYDYLRLPQKDSSNAGKRGLKHKLLFPVVLISLSNPITYPKPFLTNCAAL